MSSTIDICSCAACGYSPLDSSSCQCRVCGVKLCSTCSFITKSEKREDYTCIACLGADRFYDKLRNKAKGIQDRTAGVLSGSIKLDKYSAQTLFFHFCEIFDVLNRLLMYSTLKDMWPLLLRVVKFQEEKGMEGHLGTLQVVRFHAEPVVSAR